MGSGASLGEKRESLREELRALTTRTLQEMRLSEQRHAAGELSLDGLMIELRARGVILRALAGASARLDASERRMNEALERAALGVPTREEAARGRDR